MLKPDSTPGATPSESLGWSRASVPSELSGTRRGRQGWDPLGGGMGGRGGTSRRQSL